MTEKQAIDNGYSLTGFYSYCREDMMTQRDLIQKQGNEAIVVPIPPPLSTKLVVGIVIPTRMGYSVYWKESEENRAARIKYINATKVSKLSDKKLNLEIQLAAIQEMIDELS